MLNIVALFIALCLEYGCPGTLWFRCTGQCASMCYQTLSGECFDGCMGFCAKDGTLKGYFLNE